MMLFILTRYLENIVRLSAFSNKTTTFNTFLHQTLNTFLGKYFICFQMQWHLLAVTPVSESVSQLVGHGFSSSNPKRVAVLLSSHSIAQLLLAIASTKLCQLVSHQIMFVVPSDFSPIYCDPEGRKSDFRAIIMGWDEKKGG